MLETLNELAHLRNSGFGRPHPRHGLKLLHWFANECLSFDTNGNMLCECDPEHGDFGFHLYENRYDQNRHRLLPDMTDMSYYVVGNLNKLRAEDLPDYVSEDRFSNEDDSNTDRIIVSLNKNRFSFNNKCCFHRVYVTKHIDQSNYDPDATYRISRGLLMNIRGKSLEAFLKQTGYTQTPAYNWGSHSIDVKPDFTVNFESENGESEHSESEHSKSEHSKSEHSKSEHSESEHSKSEHSKSEHSKSEHSKSENTKSENTKSEHSKSENTKSENTKSEHSKSENTKSENTKSENTKSEHSKSENTKSENTKSEHSKSEHSESENSEPPKPAVQNKETKIQMPEISTPREKGFWESLCTIL